MNCSVNLDESSPDHFILTIEGSLNESISHLFYHLRNRLEADPKTVFFDFSQITELKDNALDDFSRFIGEIERKEIKVQILRSAVGILSQLQKEELDELLMPSEELTQKGFLKYLDVDGTLPYTLPLPSLKPKKTKKKEEPFSFEDIPPLNAPKSSTPKSKTPKTSLPSPKFAQSQALVEKILEKKNTLESDSPKKVFRLL